MKIWQKNGCYEILSYVFKKDNKGKADKKNKIKTLKDNIMTRTACLQLKLQYLTIPIPTRHHFQGSVNQVKKGIQDAKSVSPEENA